MKQIKLFYKSFSFPILMQFPIQHEKKMTLSMIHSHMKFKGFKNVLDFGKFPMFLHNFVAQATVQLESSAPAKTAGTCWARREIPGYRVP